MGANDKPIFLGLSIAFPIIAIASVIFRFEARRIKRLKLGADDWTILAALFFNLGSTVEGLIYSRSDNLGGHEYQHPYGDPTAREWIVHNQTIFIFELLVWACVGLTKISVLLLYKRIFVIHAFQVFCWCSVGLVVAWTLAMEFATIFSCLPVSSRWSFTKKSSCVDEVSFFTAALATDVISDGLILLMPIYIVWNLQMPVQRRFAVIGIFGLGALVTITGIVRLRSFILAWRSPSNQTNSYGPAIYWSIIETNVGVLSACLPTLRPLYQGYHINTIVSKISCFARGSRSTTPFRDNIRLNPVEQGFSDNISKVPRSYTRDRYAISNESDSFSAET